MFLNKFCGGLIYKTSFPNNKNAKNKKNSLDSLVSSMLFVLFFFFERGVCEAFAMHSENVSLRTSEQIKTSDAYGQLSPCLLISPFSLLMSRKLML